ncbi:type IV toxin-antitoxin system AbiEi family antitoxin domain-containing protein [Kribbella pittospori]|nr:type IV toxin-antitoxin system AbiEi family antitoxin domain-containing protein [Kribbella pittospori]
MMRAVDMLESLELVGSSQWGLVTTAQAYEAGVSKMHLSRLADRGTVQRVRHGVYALPSADTGPLQGLRAAWLSTGSQPAGNQPLAVVSGESAAAVHGLGDVLASKYEFTTAVRRQTTQPDIRYRKRDLPEGDVAWVDGLPVTSVARTVNDLATGGTDFDHLAAVVRDAVATTGVTSGSLVQALEPAVEGFGSPDGNAMLVALLKAVGFRPDTGLLELAAPELREKFFRTLAPQFEDIVSRAVNERLRQLGQGIDFSSASQHVVNAAHPDGTRDATSRQNRKIDDGGAADSAGSEPAATVPGDQVGQRGQEPRRRG